AHPYWPLFDLVVRTPRLELRLVSDEMAVHLASIADISMFEEGKSQFLSDWTDAETPVRERSSLQFWWGARATLSPDDWRLNLALVLDGELVGSQDLAATSFPLLRQVKTGSWLARPYQGRGLGTEMRYAVLHLAFVGLGAAEALSSAFETNARSIAVSRRIGYEADGSELALRGGKVPATELRFKMTAARFATVRRDDVVIEGLDPCLEMLGLEGREE
ncbi:MAG: GNAT family N-acetyltransferase, partial [Acidimicrobiales bacterium]